MATVTVALKDEIDGEWYSFLLSHEEETRLSQDPDFASLLLNSVKKNKSNTPSTSEANGAPIISTISTLPSTSQNSIPQEMDIISEVPDDDNEEKFTWSYQSVLTLMSLFKQYKDKFESPEMKKKNVWKEISKKMQEQGYIISPEQCDKKWRNLRCTYKGILVKKSLNPSHKKTWEFFNEMHDICQEDPNLNEATNPLTGTPLGYGSKLLNTTTVPSLPLYQLVQSGPGTSILKRTTLAAESNNSNVPSSKKRKTAILTSGQGATEHSEVVVLSEPRPNSEPQWVTAFRLEMRRDNERNLAEMKAMHNESLKLLKERNDILKTLVTLLDPANNNNKEQT